MAHSKHSAVFLAVCDANGDLQVDRPVSRAIRAFTRANLKNCQVEMVFRRRQVRHRTTPQMGYYWSTVIPEFAAGVGYRRDEHYALHDALMFRFWPLEPDRLTGSPRRRRLTLKDERGVGEPLSDEEMGIHIEQVVILAAEQGVVIPDADKEHVDSKNAKKAARSRSTSTSYRRSKGESSTSEAA